uniref:Uncharacterized protein n=1 Tax=Strigamia maritima TaxID=126957 RepID=T1J171_STRMM
MIGIHHRDHRHVYAVQIFALDRRNGHGLTGELTENVRLIFVHQHEYEIVRFELRERLGDRVLRFIEQNHFFRIVFIDAVEPVVNVDFVFGFDGRFVDVEDVFACQ